jgi:uncharacterized protein
MDITPAVPEGSQVITGYGPGMFRIAGVAHSGSVLVLPNRTLAWAVTDFAEIDPAGLEPILSQDPPVDVLLLGCGPAMQLPSPELRVALRERGVVLEPMDTGAACRTFNVLLTEGRRAAAALIALPDA